MEPTEGANDARGAPEGGAPEGGALEGARAQPELERVFTVTGPSGACDADADANDLRGAFAWCSLDPVSQALIVYAPEQTKLLEAACLAERSDVTIMVRPTELEHGLIAVVRFNDPSPGQHKQFTMSGTGERKVFRVADGAPTVDCGGGVVHAIPTTAYMKFSRCAWVSVEPVAGTLQPYTRENALLIEEAFHLKKSRVAVQIILPNGNLLGATITFDYKDTSKHSQSTGSGQRSANRICCDVVPLEGVQIPLYQRGEDGGIDAKRFRLEDHEGFGEHITELERVGELLVPEDVFMAETGLRVESFSGVKQMEVALGEMGYPIAMLEDLAKAMKEEPLRLAARVCTVLYSEDENVTLYKVTTQIIEDWKEKGLLGAFGTEVTGPAGYMMNKVIDEDDDDFGQICSNIFVEWDPESDVHRRLLGHQRGRNTRILLVPQIAAASLWRVVMMG